MTNNLRDILITILVAVALVSVLNSIANYHNRAGGYCDDVRNNYPEKMAYIDYQFFCADEAK